MNAHIRLGLRKSHATDTPQNLDCERTACTCVFRARTHTQIQSTRVDSIYRTPSVERLTLIGNEIMLRCLEITLKTLVTRC